jgi:pimeloyl-ACP methyl ester carboxylesterase
MPESHKAQVRSNISNIKAELLGSGFIPLERNSIREIKAPALLVTGERSIPLFHYLIRDLSRLLPHSMVSEIQGASHLMHEDNPHAFNAAVFSFMTKSSVR